MKHLIAALVLMLAASAGANPLVTGSLTAQVGDVIPLARILTWDHDAASQAITTQYNIYMSQTPGIVPDANPDDQVLSSTMEWTITAAPGQWYFIVTATTGAVESGPTNELPLFVYGDPSNAALKPVP